MLVKVANHGAKANSSVFGYPVITADIGELGRTNIFGVKDGEFFKDNIPTPVYDSPFTRFINNSPLDSGTTGKREDTTISSPLAITINSNAKFVICKVYRWINTPQYGVSTLVILSRGQSTIVYTNCPPGGTDGKAITLTFGANGLQVKGSVNSSSYSVYVEYASY